MMTLKQWFSIFLSFCLVYSQVFFNLAYAEGIETDGTTQTKLDKARNGVTIVNIAKPSSRGLSHNKFKKYNVSKQGVILNNADQSAVKTQLGGYIYGNKHLSLGSAKVILNEVTSNSRSHLNGFTEVAGQSADLVLVNPNGISMNGAGFINVPNITFSTGQANIDGGQIDSFSINQGDILIEGDGLHTKTQQATYIYTKSLQLNAKIHAQDLNVTLGSNKIDYQTKQATAQSTGPAQPDQVMLDSSALGGMYANRITLVGTDKGVGVNLPPEVLASTGDITITTDGKIQLNDLAAKTDIKVTSTDNDITLQGTTHSGNATQLDAKTDIVTDTNTTIASENEIHLTSGNAFTNQGTLMAGINTDGTANYTGTIELHNTELINQNKIATGTLTGTTVTNEEEIVSQAINADTLTNNNKLTTQDNLTINATTLTNNASISAADTLTTNSTNLDNYQTLVSGGDMNLYTTGILKNHQDATIFALENMTLAGDNAGGKSNQIINDQATIETYNGDMTIRSTYLENSTTEPTKTSSDGNPSTTTSYSGRNTNRNSSGTSYKYRTKSTTTVTTESIDIESIPTASKILSGKNLSITSNHIKNKYSLIAANANVEIETSNLDNISMEAIKLTTVRTQQDKKKYTTRCDGPAKERECHTTSSPWRHVSTNTNQYTEVIDSVYSTVQAGGSVSVVGDTIHSKNKREGVALTGRTAQSGETPSATPDIPIPEGDHGMFVIADDPDSDYLIETNPEFAFYANFISSDYMMEKLGIDPAATIKRVGDAFYENKLVRESIFQQTGRRFLNKNLKNDYDQFKYLMENALKASEDMNLVAGISLSREQINSLTSDIVWMEEKIVQGHRVFVPVVYLANQNNYTIAGGAKIIAGETVDLQVGNLVNSGTVEAGDNLSIVATDTITNLGGRLAADQDMTLQAKNDIRNTSGSIEAENITINSEDGSFIHETYAKEVSYNGNSRQVDIKTTIGHKATLNAKGNLNINTGKDITIKGADIIADDTSLTASNVNIETIQDKKKFYVTKRSNSSSTTHIGSNLNVGNLNINAEKNVKIAGSNVKADQMTVSAENINIETVQNKASKRQGNKRWASTTHAGSNIEVASLDMKAANRAKIEGSLITAEDNLRVQANQIDVLSVNDTTYYKKKSSSKGLFSSKSSSKERFTSKNKASNLSAANMELVTTAGDINVVGSNLQATENLSLDAGNNLNIKAGHDGYFYEKKTKEGGFFRNGDFYSEEENLEGKMTKTAVASNISGANVSLKSNREILVEGSNLSGGSITGEAENITVKGAENIEKTWSKTTKKSIGFGDLKDSLTRPDKVISTKDKKLTAKIADAQYEDVDKSTKKTTVASSNLEGDTITLTATSEEEFEGNILVEGSNLNAGDTISLTASNDVSVIEAKETTETKSASKKGKAELKVGVKHQAMEVLKAAEALQMAQKAAEQAKDAYDDFKDQLKQADKFYKEGLIEKEDLDDARDDAKFYKANVVLTAAAVVSATQALTGQIIASTQSSGTYGFNAEVQLDIDAIVEKAKEIKTRSVGSNLNANTIEIKAGNRAQVRGSNLNANEQIAIDAKEVEIAASRDTSEASSSTDHAHLTVNYSVYGGLSANATADFSQSSSKGTTYNNARLNSKNISITSKEDTYVTGAVVKADENLELEVGRNLKVASLQDRSRSKSNSIGVSASYSSSTNQKSGATTESQSAGFNMSSSRGKKKWVEEQTALLGGKVNIKVDNHTDLKGAKIAAVDENDKDTGNLLLQTKSLSYEDIRNKDQNNNMSLSATVSHSVTEGGPQAKGNEDKKPGEPESPFSQSGSVGMGFSDRSSITKATIGLGTIIVGKETDPILKNLNRNIDNANVDIKNTGTQMNLDDATLNVMLNPVESYNKTKNDVLQIKQMAETTIDILDIVIDKEKREDGGKDATAKQIIDAIADGFTGVNSTAEKLRNKSKNTEDLKTTEFQDGETVQKTISANYLDILDDYDVENKKPTKLASLFGLSSERFNDYKNYLGATDEESGQSFILFDQPRLDITNGLDTYRVTTAEALRQKFAQDPLYKEDGTTRNGGLETLIERAIAKNVGETWATFSNETPTTETEWYKSAKGDYEKNNHSSKADEYNTSPAQLWIANNARDGQFDDNTGLLDVANPVNVVAYDDPGLEYESNDFVSNSAAKSVGYGITDNRNKISTFTSQFIYQPIDAVLELKHEGTTQIDNLIYQPKLTLSAAAVNMLETPGNVSDFLNYNFYRATNDPLDYIADLYDQEVEYISEGTYVKDMTKLAIGFYSGKTLLKAPGVINREIMEARLRRGIPQGFNSRNFAQFKSNVQSLIKEANLPKGTLEIQGSRVKGTAASATTDIDLIFRVDKEAFEKFAAQRIDSVHTGTKLQKALIKAAKKEKLSKFDISKEFASKIYEKVVPGSPVKNIQFSIIVEGSKYDTGPFLPIGD